jgi:hypothetical protein
MLAAVRPCPKRANGVVSRDRLLIHTAGLNLGLLMRQLIGVSTPRGPQRRLIAFVVALRHAMDEDDRFRMRRDRTGNRSTRSLAMSQIPLELVQPRGVAVGDVPLIVLQSGAFGLDLIEQHAGERWQRVACEPSVVRPEARA